LQTTPLQKQNITDLIGFHIHFTKLLTKSNLPWYIHPIVTKQRYIQ